MPPTAPTAVVADYTLSTPTAPAAVVAAASGSAPSAPAAVVAGFSLSAPTAPSAVVAAGSASSPTAPVEVVTSNSRDLQITGSLTPAVTGLYQRVASPVSGVFGRGKQWSTDGQPARSGVGVWSNIYQAFAVTPASATVNDIFPPANYTATDSQSTATQITFNSYPFGAYTSYWLYNNPGTGPRWLITGSASVADRGSDTIAAGKTMFSVIRSPSNLDKGGYVGGLAETWWPTLSFLWFMLASNNTTYTGFWFVISTFPTSGTWAPATGSGSIGGTAGTPVAALVGLPETIPTAADAVVAAASAASPTAPASVVAAGSASSPTAPTAVVSAYSPSNPTAPVGLV